MTDTSIAKGLTSTFDPTDVDMRTYRGKWQTEEEFKIAEKVWERLRTMQQGRRTSCYFPSKDTEVSDQSTDSESATASSDGGNWLTAWNRWDKQHLMHRKELGDTVNIKSSMSFAPIEATLAEFMSGDIVPLIRNVEADDAERIKLISLAHEWLRKFAKINRVNYATLHEAAIRGTSIRYVGYFNKQREVEIIQDKDDLEEDLKKARKEKDKIRIDEITKQLDEQNKPITKTEMHTDYDNIGHVRVPLEEFYVDPDAQELRDHMYEATDCVWRQTPSVEQCLSEFRDSKDPWVKTKNVKKIVSANSSREAYGDDTPFYKAPKDINSKTQVELIRYYNKQTDKYVVIANDVVIRDGPLPYNHKQLPFVLHRLIKKEGQFYGYGIPAILESLQTYSEILMSIHLEQAAINLAPPLIYNTQFAEDIDNWERYAAGQKLGINGPVDDSVVRWMQPSHPVMEYNAIQQELAQHAIQVTGINPMSYAMPQPGEAVRTHMLTMESTLKIIKKHIKTWGEGYTDAVWMDIRLMQQIWPSSYTEEVKGEETIKKYQTIPLYGKQIDIEENEEGMKVQLNDSVKDSSFEMKGEYLELSGDFDIEIDLDSIAAPSQGLMMQKSEQALAQLFPILQQWPQISQIPGMVELVKWYGETHFVPSKVFEQMQDSSSDEDIAYADEENKAMLRGQVVPGTPGASPAHLMQHTQQLLQLIAEVNKPLPQPDPMMPIDPKKEIIEEQKRMRDSDALNQQIMVLSDHIKVDSMPKEISPMAAIQMGQPPAPPAPQGAPMSPQGLGMMPPQGGQMPMMPTSPTGMEGAPGGDMGVPM